MRPHFILASAHLGLILAGLSIATGCEVTPAASISDQPPLAVSLEVESVFPKLEPWEVNNFWDLVRDDLAKKYRITVVSGDDTRSGAATVAIGDWRDRISVGSRTIRVEVALADGTNRVKPIRVPDFEPTTLDFATEYVAAIIATSMRSPAVTPAPAP